MISNLFNIFEPSSSVNFSINWLSIFFIFFFLCSFYWLVPSRFYMVGSILVYRIYFEFKDLILKNPFMLMFSLIIFLYIIFNNFFGLFPYIFTARSHMEFTLSFALPFTFS